MNAVIFENIFKTVICCVDNSFVVEDRCFSVPELRILIDAIQASCFITTKKAKELIDKIANLAGEHKAEVLKNNLVYYNSRKHTNENIYYNISSLENAIIRKQKVLFRYFHLNEIRERVYKYDDQYRYIVDPIALIINEDNYYLVSYSPQHDNIRHYRIDRMDSVQVLDEPCCEKAIGLRDQIDEHVEQAFKMFGGEKYDVILSFDRDLIGSVYDRFGENTKMMPFSTDKCIAYVKVQVSPVFWGWLFQFGNKMKLLAPDSLAAQYKELAKEILSSYSES